MRYVLLIVLLLQSVTCVAEEVIVVPKVVRAAPRGIKLHNDKDAYYHPNGFRSNWLKSDFYIAGAEFGLADTRRQRHEENSKLEEQYKWLKIKSTTSLSY